MSTKINVRGLLLFAYLLLCSLTAKADSLHYIVTNTFIATSEGSVVAGDDFGDFTLKLNYNLPCGPQYISCYETHYATGQILFSLSIPTLVADPYVVPGPGCTIDHSLFSGGVIDLCNNGYELIYGYRDGHSGLWAGDSKASFSIYGNGVTGPYIFTPNGTFYFVDGATEDLIIAYPVTTPEPSSLLLVASGAAVVTRLRRRKPIPEE